MKKTPANDPTALPAPVAADAAQAETFRFASADIVETDESIQVFADVPGASESAASVTLDGDILTLEARTASRPCASPSMSEWSESGEGIWRRQFVLSEAVDRAHITATVKDGVLHLVLPKAAPARPHRIEVHAG